MPIRIGNTYDPDAVSFFSRITAAGSSISYPNMLVVSDFIRGCKNDNNWNAIKASCLLCAADSLAGALVPLVGPAPTNVGGLFVEGDYSRTTGLKGNGTTKYLNANRGNEADPQNSRHLAVWRTESETRDAFRCSIGNVGGGQTMILSSTATRFYRSAGGDLQVSDTTALPGFLAHSRSASNSFVYRYAGTSGSSTAASSTPTASPNFIFSLSFGTYPSNARISFYSIGEHLDLIALESRLSILMASLT